MKLHSARFPDPAPFQLPDPRRPARSLTDLLTALAAILGRRQPHNVPPLHTAQAVHEVVGEEYRTLESANYELATYTPADWVRLFETRFSLSVEHLRQRLTLCLASDLSGTAHIPSSPRQVASEALLGSSRAWSGPASCCQGSLRVKPRWLGPPPLTRVLLLFLRLLSLASFQDV